MESHVAARGARIGGGDLGPRVASPDTPDRQGGATAERRETERYRAIFGLPGRSRRRCRIAIAVGPGIWDLGECRDLRAHDRVVDQGALRNGCRELASGAACVE